MAHSPESITFASPDTPGTPGAHIKHESPKPSLKTVPMEAPKFRDHHEAQRRRVSKKPRSVANMTQEQRDRKRENDRVAQRAIREKTKQRISELEAVIERLKNSDHNKELQAAIQAKEAVEAENVEIKKQLRVIASKLKQLSGQGQGQSQGQTSPEESAYASPASQACLPAQSSGLPPPSGPLAPTIVSTPSSISSASAAVPDPLTTRTQQDVPFTVSQQTQALIRQSEDLQRGLEMGTDRINFNFLVSKPSSVPEFLSTTGSRNGLSDGRNSFPFYDLPSQYQVPRPLPAHRHSSTSSQFSASSSYTIPDTTSSRYSTSQQGDAYRSSDGGPPIWSVTPRNSDPTCLLDNILLQFLRERRELLALGQPRADVVGPKYPSVSSLLNKEEDRTAHPLSSIFTAIIGTFPNLSRLPEQVGVVYMMFLTMRWQVEPTRENYEHMPSFFHPGPAQLQVPHPVWMDHLPFPRMREYMMRHQADFELENFFVPFTNTLSVNWPYEDSYVLIQNPDTAEITINPVFDLHVRNPNNWTAGEAFKKKFPELTGTYNYKG